MQRLLQKTLCTPICDLDDSVHVSAVCNQQPDQIDAKSWPASVYAYGAWIYDSTEKFSV